MTVEEMINQLSKQPLDYEVYDSYSRKILYLKRDNVMKRIILTDTEHPLDALDWQEWKPDRSSLTVTKCYDCGDDIEAGEVFMFTVQCVGVLNKAYFMHMKCFGEQVRKWR